MHERRAKLGKVKCEETVPVNYHEVEARHLINQLDALPAAARDSYLPRRLRETLDVVLRKSSADELQEDLRFFSDVDAGRAHSSYAMVRIIIWAIPILGFLGTVIGITIAIAGLDPKLLENSLPVVTSGLGVAFDTTALALALSMVLMFGQFFIDKAEAKLLNDVDERANDMLTPRFPRAGSEQDPQLNGVRRMAEAVISSVERTVERQAELWNSTITASNERWESVTSAGRDQLEEAFGKALSRAMESHRKHMAAIEDGSAEQNRKHWLQVQHALEACAASNASQQLELRRQCDSLLQIVNGAGQVRQLEEALSRNLTTLSSSQHLQETLMNLTGAVNALIEKAGLRIVAQKRIRMTRDQAETFYAVHKARPFFGGLTGFALFTLSRAGAVRLAQLLLAKTAEDDAFDELEQGALLELGNIVIGSTVGMLASGLAKKASAIRSA